ncbi:hypothetical protein FSARC_4152 [Fusarium sarcochroum]|uniref:Zn(2)-C6 fungal-type domain-containing protein n=1 Tax=Fusarium sarcochroum TaxID=1208366 RepID=A0A8H4U2A9_9HYPO|nr:hypothetical protein FSARC_4152 [Fusarium sarcochroum]
MVGIAGKSKACHDCKRRRVKCDLTHPLCQRCSKAGIACRGYTKSTLWVNQTQARPKVTALSVVADARLQQRNPETSTLPCWLVLLQRMRVGLNSGDSSYDVQRFRLEALFIAESIYFPRGVTMTNVEGSDSLPSSWLKAVCQLQRPSDALDHSLLAFCAIQVRLSSKATISHDETIQLYNHALSRIIAILDSPSAGNSDESLAAIVVLSTCEVIQAMVMKHFLTLEPDTWRQLIGSPVNSGTLSGLLDIIMDVPSAMAGARLLIARNERDSVELIHFANLLIQKFHDLDNWRSLHHHCPDQPPLYWSIPSKASNPADDHQNDKLFPFALIFSSIQQATAWIFCSSTMLDVLNTILLLRSSSITTNITLSHVDDVLQGTILDHSASSVLLQVQADADKLARMLCQSIEYCYLVADMVGNLSGAKP